MTKNLSDGSTTVTREDGSRLACGPSVIDGDGRPTEAEMGIIVAAFRR